MNEFVIGYVDSKEACELLLDNIHGQRKIIFKLPVEISGYDFTKLYETRYPDVPSNFTEFHIKNCVFEWWLIVKSIMNTSLLSQEISKIDKNGDFSYFKLMTISWVVLKNLEIQSLFIDSLYISWVTITEEFNSQYDSKHSNQVKISNNIVNQMRIQQLNSTKNSIHENNIHDLIIEGLIKNEMTSIEENHSISEIYLKEYYYDLERDNRYYIDKLKIHRNDRIGSIRSDYQSIKEIDVYDNRTICELDIHDSHNINRLRLGNGEIKEASFFDLSCDTLIFFEIITEKCLRLNFDHFRSIRFENCIDINECILSGIWRSSKDNELFINNSNFTWKLIISGNEPLPLLLQLENTFLDSKYSIFKNLDLTISMTGSDLGNTLIQNSKVTLCAFENSLIGNIKIDTSSIDNDSIIKNIYDLETKAKVLHQIGKMYFENNNYVEFNKLLSLELDNNTTILSQKWQFFNAWILKFQKKISDYWNSPWKVVAYMLLGWVVFTLLFLVSQSENIAKIQNLNVTLSDIQKFFACIIISYIPLLNVKYFFEFKNLGTIQYLLILLYSVFYPVMAYLLIVSMKKLTQYSKIW